MKKLTAISLIIFFIITTAILTAGLVFYDRKNNQSASNTAAALNLNAAGASGLSSVVSGSQPVVIVLNSAEIAKHNQPKDCWLIINNKIYNVTSYLSAHPGGVGTITPYCGKEATQAFATKGGGGSHSNYAYSLLTNYYIGDLNSTANQAQVQKNVKNANNSVLPAGGGEDEHEDD